MLIEIAKKRNFKDIIFLRRCKYRKEINIYFNVIGYENERPYHIDTSKQTFEKGIDLLLLSISKCFLIKDFNRFMIKKAKYHNQNYFCFKVLEFHVKN